MSNFVLGKGSGVRGFTHHGFNRRGFTLVELLVVIGIIGVLVSILLPSLNRARRAARDVQCQNNLKEIYNACQQYALAFKDVFPSAQDIGPGDFRRGAGEIGLTLPSWTVNGNPPNDFVPSNNEETFGLPAMFHRLGYIKGASLSTRDIRGDNDPNGLPPAGTAMAARSSNKVWICPSASEEMQDFGNTYEWKNSAVVFSQGPGKPSGRMKSIHRGRKGGVGAAFNSAFESAATKEYVLDNVGNFPHNTGLTTGPSGAIPERFRVYPHRFSGTGRPTPAFPNGVRAFRGFSVQTLFLDGHVGRSVYHLNSGQNPANYPNITLGRLAIP